MFSANSSQVSEDRLYVEDVFSTYLYTGNGSTQTITNGIDLAGKGGMVWTKGRNVAYAAAIADTISGTQKYLVPSETLAYQSVSNSFTSYNSSGFTVGGDFNTNASTYTYASWTFRKAPKFFDVVTYTGDGTAGRTVAHSLGAVPGMIIVKCVDGLQNWAVFHRSLTGNNWLRLNTTDTSSANSNIWNNTNPTSTVFTVGAGNVVNQPGLTYVAYIFGHDTTSDGIIQCGSYTGNGSATGPTVTLGWEPQWVLVKNATVGYDWWMLDNMRGFTVPSVNDAYLVPNLTSAEAATQDIMSPTATGFQLSTSGPMFNGSGSTYVYIAIRRGPMRTPTSGTSVFAPTATTAAAGTVINTGFPIDLQISSSRDAAGNNGAVFDRLRTINPDNNNGTTAYKMLLTQNNSPEDNTSGIRGWNNTEFRVPQLFTAQNRIYWNFRRAPGFFDEVCYTGAGATTISHNLGVAPEIMIVKSRSGFNDWYVYSASVGETKALRLNVNGTPLTSSAWWNNTAPTSTVFTVGSDAGVSGSGTTFVAYLFASCPGVSKCGSYTGNGSSQTINCGFAAGARFVMIKRTDSTGDWYVWDTARGIVAGNDPHLSLNATNAALAEVTSNDTIDTDSSGFVVNQVAATNINVSSATYIYLAVA
jgi:hypothetical protein